MGRCFADTYFWLALIRERDADHRRAVDCWGRLGTGEVITTAWVLVELADGMSRQGSRGVCARFVEDLRNERTVRVIEPDVSLLWRGFDLYRDRADKEWSLTDCISFVVMADEGLTQALTGDRHFEQAGFVALLSGA